MSFFWDWRLKALYLHTISLPILVFNFLPTMFALLLPLWRLSSWLEKMKANSEVSWLVLFAFCHLLAFYCLLTSRQPSLNLAKGSPTLPSETYFEYSTSFSEIRTNLPIYSVVLCLFSLLKSTFHIPLKSEPMKECPLQYIGSCICGPLTKVSPLLHQTPFRPHMLVTVANCFSLSGYLLLFVSCFWCHALSPDSVFNHGSQIQILQWPSWRGWCVPSDRAAITHSPLTVPYRIDSPLW